MAVKDARVSRATDGVSIALLRRLHAGAEIPYVHRADVCSAAPSDLVASLMPAPAGTDQTEDGRDSIWYFYCPKRYKNTQGKASGHRQRAIEPRGETCWHPEGAAKNVPGSEGGTFCTFSYGRMKDGSLERMGWSMVEYDVVVDEQAAATAASSYVLCKVYRPSRGKGKPSSSSSKSAATSSCSKRKRKAGISGNPEAPPTKLIHIQREQVHQRSAEKEKTGEFVVPVAAEVTVEDLLGPETMSGECIGLTTASVPLDDDFFIGVETECFFGAQEEARTQPSSSHSPSWSMAPSSPTCPVEPVVTEVTIEDLFGPEMMPGECVSLPAANTPPDDDFFAGADTECLFGAQEDARSRASSSHAPSWSMATSSSAGCSRLVQEPPLWIPYLMCS